MTPIMQWAQRWQIPAQMLAELMGGVLGVGPAESIPARFDGAEAGVQQQVRLRAADRGARLWRNNSGACEDKTGRLVRYGLANDSPAVNKIFKSSDLIGITPIVVTHPMVGGTVGIFTAAECKEPGWRYAGDKACSCRPHSSQCKPCREKAQFAFLSLVNGLGGIGKFVSNPEDF